MDGYLLFYNETKDPLKVFLKGFNILIACFRSSTYAGGHYSISARPFGNVNIQSERSKSGRITNTNTNTNNLFPPFQICYNKVCMIITIVNMITQLYEFLSPFKKDGTLSPLVFVTDVWITLCSFL
jgi:hypothetical protein